MTTGIYNRYQEGDRWNVLISLRTTKMRGDVMDFRSERTVKDGFTRREEWRQVEIRHHTRQLKLSVIFPRKRPCRRALLLQRSRNRTIALGQEVFHNLPDGRQILTWETKNVIPLEVYTLKWWW